MSEQKAELIVFCLIFSTVFLAFSNILDSSFVFDDFGQIVINSPIQLKSLDISSLKSVLTDSRAPTRPVANLSFALNYYMGGLNPIGYKAVNILIHTINCWLLYLLIKSTLSLGQSAATGRRLAAASFAILWALHPSSTESVTYVVQRMSSLSFLFFISSILFYIRFRNRAGIKALSASIISALLAAGTKETAIAIPVIIMLYEFLFFRKSHRQIRFVTMILAGIFSLYFLQLLTRAFSSLTLTEIIQPLYIRILTEARVLCHYLSLIPFSPPSRLNLDPDIPLSTSLVSPLSTLGAVLFLAMLAMFMFRSLKQKEPVVFLGISWFFITAVPETFYYKLDIQADHRVYLPYAGLFLLGAYYFEKLQAGKKIRKRGKEVIFLSLLAFGILQAYWTYNRNLAWANEISIWEDTASKSPAKARPHANLGAAYQIAGRKEEAVAEYKKTLLINPGFFSSVTNLSKIYEDDENTGQAISVYKRAVKANPENFIFHYNLGGLYAKKEMEKEALNEYNTSIKINNGYIPAIREIAKLNEKNKNYSSATDAYRNILRLGDTSAYYNIALIYQKQKIWEKAKENYLKAISYYPDLYWAHTNLGIVLGKLGEHSNAEKEYLAAIEADPSIPAAHLNLALLLVSTGRTNDALKKLYLAEKLFPDNLLIAMNIGNIYMILGDFKSAEDAYLKAIEIDNSIVEPYNNLTAAYRKQKKYQQAGVVEEKAKRLREGTESKH